MANRYPLILNATAGQLQELPIGDSLDLGGESIINVGSLSVTGNLTVSGTTTSIETVNLSVKDKNIELGVSASPTDALADGGGITLKGTTDKTLTWVQSTASWTSNQPFAAPSLVPTGSTVPTNGVYLPAANTVGVATNGQGRLYIDASGNVGIGSTSGSNKLVIAGTTSNLLRLDNNYGTSNAYGIEFYSSRDVGNTPYVTASLLSSHGGGFTNPFFSINVSDASRLIQERLRITSAGLVGIGTSSPGSNLHIAGGSAPVVAQVGSTAGGETGAIIYHGTGTKYNWRIGAQQTTDNAFEFARSTNLGGTTFNSPYLLINSAGNVGIGTTSPQTNFVVSNAGAAGLEINPVGFDSGSIIQAFNRSTAAYTALNTYSSYVAFNTGASATERARIDSSGRLLVGTSSTPISSTAVLQGRSGVTTGEAILRLCRGQDTPADAAVLGEISFGDSNNGDAARIFAQRDGGTWTSASSRPARLVFSTAADGASSPTERMRIYNDGRTEQWSSNVVTFGTSSSQAAGSSNYLYIGRYGATGNAGGTTSFFVYTSGDVRNTNNSYGAISDIKLKENIVDATSQWDDIKALQVRNYNFKEGQTHTQIGLVAQEVELVSPGLVSESPDRDAEGNDLGTVTKSVNYSVLYMKAVKALQEAMERIEVLEQRLTNAGIA